MSTLDAPVCAILPCRPTPICRPVGSEQHWNRLGRAGSYDPYLTCLAVGIWIGNLATAAAEYAAQNGFTAVLNCTHNQWASGDVQRFNIAWKRFVIPDFKKQYNYEELMDLLNYLRLQLQPSSKRPPKLLIHCLAGRHRAATVSAVALIAHRNFSLSAAIDHIHAVRSKSHIYGSNLNWLEWAYQHL